MRRTGPILTFLAVAIAVSAGPALAEEVIYFTNGTSMPIVRHEVRDDMIHVDLGSESFMAFPMRMVEKIEEAGKDVMLKPSMSTNRILKGSGPDPSVNYPVTATPGRDRDAERKLPIQRAAEDPQVQLDSHGMAVYRPHQHSRSRGKRMVGATGNQRVLTGGGGNSYIGAKRVGNRHVIGGNERPAASRGGKVPVVGLAKNPAAVNQSSGSNSNRNNNNSGNNGSNQDGSSSSGSGD